MALRYEAWTTPWDPGGFKRKVAMLPVIEGTGRGSVEFMSVGRDASADISLADFDRLGDLVSNTESSLITVYDCDHTGTNTIIDEWVLDRVPQHFVEDREVSLAGPNLLREAFDKALVYAFDYPKSPSITRDWIWGKNQDDDSTGLIRNGTFEDVPMPNGGFEDGNAGHWQGTEDDGNLIGDGAISAVSSAIDARTGSWYGSVNPLAQGGGARRSIAGLVPGENYTITGWINESSGSGDRLRAGVVGASTATHTNAYEEPIDPDIPGIWWAEIGNATEGTGASDGTWQSVTLTFKPESDSVELVIVYDDVNDRTFRIDDFAISGDNVGLEPWVPFFNGNGQGTVLNIGRHSTSRAHNGAGSCEIQGVDGPYYDNFGRIGYGTFGIGQTVRMVPGRLYTFTAWVQHAGNGANGANELIRTVLNRKTPKGELDKTLTGDFVPGPGSYYMASKTVLVPQNTWTKIQMTVYADVSEVGVEVRYVGTDTRNTDVGTFNSPNIWIDDVSIHEGLPATTIGDIWQTLLDDCTTNHENDTRGTILEWIDYSSFDDVNDSNGNPWNEDIPFLARWGSSMGHVLDDTFDRGYEIELVRKTTPSGGKTHDLHLYNAGGRDDNPSTAIHSAQPITGGESLRRNPAYTSVVVASPQGAYTEDSDATALTNFGRSETFQMDSEASGPVSRQLLADNLINYEQANRNAVRFDVIEALGVPRPFHDYRPGDTIPMTMAPGLMKEDRRVQRVDYVNTQPARYSVVGSRIIEGEAAAFDLVARLWRRLQRPGKFEDPDLGLGSGADAGFFAIDVAAADAPSWEKAVARYQCDGVDDDVEIMAALSEQNYYSQCTLSSGTFHVREGWIGFDGQTLRGQGSGATFIRNQGVGTEADQPSSFNGTFLVDVGSDAELTDIGFRTTFDFVGTCLLVDYGYVHNVAHQDGNAQRFMYVRGTIRPMNHIQSWASYDGPSSVKAMIEFDEGWYVLTNLFANVRGPALLLDSFGIASISGASIQITTDHPGIIVDNTGYLTMGDVALLSTVSGQTSAGIEVRSYPFGFEMSNTVVQGFGYGLKIGGTFNGIDVMDISNFFVAPRISGMDIDLGSTTSQDAETGDMMIRGYRCVGRTHNATGWGLRLNVARNTDSVIISDFDIRDMDEAGILLHQYEGGSNPPVHASIIHDGILKNIGKHGVELARINAHVHDVVVDGAGEAAANTYDAFHLSGQMMRTMLHDNKIRQENQLRYGINVSEASVEQTVIVGNSDEGGAFGTDALNDQGTGTLLSYPSDATYGDNFFGGLANVDQIEPVVTASLFDFNPNVGERERVPFQGVVPVTSNTITVTEATETESGETITPT